MTPRDRESTEAVLSYQRYVGRTSRMYHRAAKGAVRDLMDDIAGILRTYTAKGGFADPSEAMRYLREYADPDDIAVLIRRARDLPEPDRTRWLTRLSSPAYTYRMTRAKAVAKAAVLNSSLLTRQARDTIGRQVERTVKEGIKRTVYSMERDVGYAIDWTMPNRAVIDQVVRGTGVYDKVKLFSDIQMRTVRETIVKGMLSGRDMLSMQRQVMGDTDRTAYESRRLIRTTIGQAAADAELMELKELGCDEYEIVCVLDEKTCPICSQHDGKRYRMGEGPTPTFHPNCRCRVRQVLPDEYTEGMTRAARDKDGRTIKVPRSMTWDEWDKQYGK